MNTRRSIRIGPGAGLIPALAYLALFYVVPLLYLVLASFRRSQGSGLAFAPGLTTLNYLEFFNSEAALVAWARSLGIATASVGLAVLASYPIAYTLVFSVPARYQRLFLLIIIAPFWTSFVVRSFAWQLVLADSGPLNLTLSLLGLPKLGILNTHVATVLGLTVFCSMLMTLNLYSVMEGIDRSLLAAAANLGARRWATFWEIIVPLTRPGLATGCILAFIVSFGDFVVPQLLGGGLRTVLSQALVGAIGNTFNVPRASTLAVVMLVTILVAIVPLLQLARQDPRKERA